MNVGEAEVGESGCVRVDGLCIFLYVDGLDIAVYLGGVIEFQFDLHFFEMDIVVI